MMARSVAGGVVEEVDVAGRAGVGSSVRIGVLVVLILMTLSACSGGGFSIQGTWRSVGETGWGQAQPGAIVEFSDTEATLYSPRDIYALTRDGDDYKLEVTGVLGGTSTFTVKVISSNDIELYSGSGSTPAVVLERVS